MPRLSEVAHRERAADMVIAPRDYQDECLTAIRDAFDGGVWSQAIVLPTGSGKTVIFALLIARLSDFLDRFPWFRQRVLVIAHRDALIEQAARKIRAANPSLSVEVEKGDQVATPMADIVVASMQTLAPRGCARLQQMNPDRFRIVIVDEAHHVPSTSYQDVLRVLGLVPPASLLPGKGDDLHAGRERVAAWRRTVTTDRLLLGFTATAARADAVGLEWTFQQVVYEKSLRWMIERGYLVPPVGYLVPTDVNLDTVKTLGGDFNVHSLSAICNTPARNRELLAAWAHRAKDRKTIGFTIDIRHARDLADLWRAHGIAAEMVSGELTVDDQRAAQSRFASGATRVLMNAQLLTEGYDEPSIDCVLLAKPTKSHGLFVQMLGRGLRLYDGKRDCLVLDAADNSTRHSLVNLGDIFGLPPHFDAHGTSIVTAAIEFERLSEDYPGLDLSDASTIEEMQKRVRHIDLWNVRRSAVAAEYASMNWIKDPRGVFHLSVPRLNAVTNQLETKAGDTLSIAEDTLGGYRIHLRSAGTVEPLGMVDDLAGAFARAERWVSLYRPHVVAMKAKDAPWRERLPTTKQLEALARMRCPVVPRTRGEASDLFDTFLARKSHA